MEKSDGDVSFLGCGSTLMYNEENRSIGVKNDER